MVTGGNRGLGLEIVRALAEEEGMVVVLAARDAEAGTRACKELKMPNVIFQQLDVQDPTSIAGFASWLQAHLSGLDILINNAAINGVLIDEEACVKYNIKPGQVFTDADARKKVLINDYEISKKCIDVNYYGSKRVIEALLPLFKASQGGAHIINVSSILGQLQLLPNETLRQQLNDVETLTEEFIGDTLQRYLNDLKEGKLEEQRWPIDFSSYVISKICLNTYTRILTKELESRLDGHKIHVNAVHPGWVKTDMTWKTGEFTPQESALALVWIALQNDSSPPSGEFFYFRKPLSF